MPTYGDTMGSGGAGTYPDPITLAGTNVQALSSPMTALAARVHMLSNNNQVNLGELYYYDRYNSTWYPFPSQFQPVMSLNQHPILQRQVQQTPVLSFSIIDPFGDLTPENLNSAWNYDHGGNYSPLMDEARPILWRFGSLCAYNLASGIAPTSTLAPAAGTLAALTDGVMGNIASASTSYTSFSPTSTAPFDIIVNVGSLTNISHAVIRFASKIGTCSLPASVTFAASADNVTYVAFPARPIGAMGGDWDEDVAGRTLEIARADFGANAQYVKITVTPTGAQTIMIDELAVYGGAGGLYLGKNMFYGFLGDSIQFTSTGICSVQATGVEKKLQDNNENRFTLAYYNQDIGDIAWQLLTTAKYWPGGVTYSKYLSAFPPSTVGWGNLSQLTGLMMPVWQSQNNNMWGYLQELFHEVGWLVYGDGNGFIQALEPPYRQVLPTRVCIAALDGNDDVRACVRDRSGKDLRNVVDMQASSTLGAGVRTVLQNPASVGRYDKRRMNVTDPVATQRDFQAKIANKILRDYAWRLQLLNNQINVDFDTNLRDVFGFRAPAIPNLYAAASTITNQKRLKENWALDSVAIHFMRQGMPGDCTWIPYVAAGPDPPSITTLIAGTGALNTTATVSFTAPTDPHVKFVTAYVSSTSDTSGFTVYAGPTSTAGVTSLTITGLTVGTQYWVDLTFTDDRNQESNPSTVLSFVAGTSNASVSDWAVTDLAGAVNQVLGPDGQGHYSYEIALSWTAPPAGYKRMEMYYNIGTLPANQTSTNSYGGWTYQDEFHGSYVFAGTALGWNARIDSPVALASGSKIWFRMLTTTRNSSDGGGWYWSNETFITIP